MPTERGRLRPRGPKLGPSKVVSVEVRKKRTYVKRSVVAEEEAARIKEETAERDRVKAEEAALLRQEEERLAAERLRVEEERDAQARRGEEAEARKTRRRGRSGDGGVAGSRAGADHRGGRGH